MAFGEMALDRISAFAKWTLRQNGFDEISFGETSR
jgi:hypothetical protein